MMKGDITSIKDKLEEHDGRFNTIEATLSTMKTDLFFIKNELKQKVSHEEFATLEKRVNPLESKLNRQK